MLPSYRNQSIDLDSKSINWFLYKGKLALNGLTSSKILLHRSVSSFQNCLNYSDQQILKEIDPKSNIKKQQTSEININRRGWYRNKVGLYYSISGLSIKPNKDNRKLSQTFSNSQVAQNIEIASNKIGCIIKYGLWPCCKEKLNYRLYNLLSFLYILAMLTVRRLRLVRLVFSLSFGRTQSLKEMENGGILFHFLEMESIQNRHRIYDNLEFKGWVTVLFKRWWMMKCLSLNFSFYVL